MQLQHTCSKCPRRTVACCPSPCKAGGGGGTPPPRRNCLAPSPAGRPTPGLVGAAGQITVPCFCKRRRLVLPECFDCPGGLPAAGDIQIMEQLLAQVLAWLARGTCLLQPPRLPPSAPRSDAACPPPFFLFTCLPPPPTRPATAPFAIAHTPPACRRLAAASRPPCCRLPQITLPDDAAVASPSCYEFVHQRPPSHQLSIDLRRDHRLSESAVLLLLAVLWGCSSLALHELYLSNLSLAGARLQGRRRQGRSLGVPGRWRGAMMPRPRLRCPHKT